MRNDREPMIRLSSFDDSNGDIEYLWLAGDRLINKMMKFHRRVIHGALGEAERCVMASLRKPRGEKSYYKKMKTNISPFCCCDVIKDIGSSQEEEDNLVGRQASVEKRPIHLTANGPLFFSLIFLPNGLCIHARAHFICFVVVVFLFFSSFSFRALWMHTCAQLLLYLRNQKGFVRLTLACVGVYVRDNELGIIVSSSRSEKMKKSETKNGGPIICQWRTSVSSSWKDSSHSFRNEDTSPSF